MKKLFLIFIIGFLNFNVNSQYPIFPIGTKWTYEFYPYSINPNLLQHSFVTYEITDTIQFAEKLVYKIETNNPKVPGQLMFQDNEKIYFWEPEIDEFQLTYDFNALHSYDTRYTNICGQTTPVFNAKVSIDAIDCCLNFENWGSRYIQQVSIPYYENSMSDDSLKKEIIEYVGNKEGGLRIELGRGLCDNFEDGDIGKIRCFEKGGTDIKVNLSGFFGDVVTCDSIWDEYRYVTVNEFAPLGTEWYYSGVLNITGGYFGGYEKDIVAKDTFIEGKLCKVVERTYFSNTDTIIKPNAIFHQENSRIYTYFNNKFNLYFDYNWKIGDSVRISRWSDLQESALASIFRIETKKYKEDSLRLFYIYILGDSCIDLSGNKHEIVVFNEKFGPIDNNLAYNEMDFFNEMHNFYFLRCYSDNDFGYINFDDVSCDSIRVGTNEIIIIEDLTIYPNPASDHISLVFPEGFCAEKCQIFDILGREVKDKITDFEKIDISDKKQGMYFIKLKDRDGRIAIGKFMVE